MGIGFVAVAWLAVSLAASLIGAAILSATVALVTRNVPHLRRRTIIAAFVLPFLCVGWSGSVFVFQAIVNSFHHRDPGIGDLWECPLPNGYGLMMIDVPDHAFVFNPASQGWDTVACVDDCAADVTAAQISGRYVLGRSDSVEPSLGSATPKPRAPKYFLLDTQVAKRQDFDSLNDLTKAADALHLTMGLRPIEDVYKDCRFTWFDKMAAIILFAPPLFAFATLVVWVLYLRKISNA